MPLRIHASGRFFCLLVLIVCTGSLAPARFALPVAHAATLTVTTTDDELNNDGDCSLREAIQATNLDIPVDECPPGTGHDLIELPAATYVISQAGSGDDTGLTGDLDITSDLTIRGFDPAATVLDGNQLDRVFDVPTSANVTFLNITVRNGRSSDQSGGAIGNAGTMTIINSAVVENTAEKRAKGATPVVVAGGIFNAGTLTLVDTSIRSNKLIMPIAPVLDSADDAGGGIYSTGTLSIIRSAITANHGTDGGGVYSTGTLSLIQSAISRNAASFGGGIYSTGTLHLSHSSVTENEVAGFAGDGGGIYNADNGSVALMHSHITGNRAGGRNGGNGGGIVNSGNLLAVESMISMNIAWSAFDGGGAGGGIYNDDGATLTLIQSTVNGNFASGAYYGSGHGGGIDNQGLLVMKNSTVSGNRTEAETSTDGGGSSGGGIGNHRGEIYISDSTISANVVAHATGRAASGAGIDTTDQAEVTLHNTIVAGNTDSEGQQADCAGTIVSEGYNLLQTTVGCTITGNMSGNLLNVPAALDPLQNNGGPTMTHALQSSSPAMDAGSPESCPALDQRGMSRPRDGNGDGTWRCDIGAYEREKVVVLGEQLYLPLLTQAR